MDLMTLSIMELRAYQKDYVAGYHDCWDGDSNDKGSGSINSGGSDKIGIRILAGYINSETGPFDVTVTPVPWNSQNMER